MRTSQTTIWILILVCLFSCERVIPYPNLAEEDALLNVSCEVTPSDSTTVTVSRLFAITHEHRDKEDYSKPLNSKLQFFVNGKEVPVQQTYSDQQDIYSVVYPFQQGDQVSLICSAPELPTVTASTQIPHAPSTIIQEFKLIKDEATLGGYLVLKDNPDTFDAYEVSIALTEYYTQFENGEIVSTGKYGHGSYTINPHVAEWRQVLDDTYADKHSDITINLQNIKLQYKPKTEIVNGVERITKTWLESKATVHVLSKELYYFNLRYESHSMSPTCYTNIKGGYGLLGAQASVSSTTIKLE